VRLRQVSSGKYISFNKVYTDSSSYYNCGSVNDNFKYNMNNWWVFYR